MDFMDCMDCMDCMDYMNIKIDIITFHSLRQMKQMNQLILTLKKGMVYSFYFGFVAGMVPNQMMVIFNKKKYPKVPLPFITGSLGVIGFLSSPLIVANYLFNGTYIDKFVDKYEIDFKRHHQYDHNQNKYAYPSNIVVKIEEVNSEKKEKTNLIV